MKLLLTTDAVGGVWTYSLDLARALAPHGVETVLAVMGPVPDLKDKALNPFTLSLSKGSPDLALKGEREGFDRLSPNGFAYSWSPSAPPEAMLAPAANDRPFQHP